LISTVDLSTTAAVAAINNLYQDKYGKLKNL